jgi:hypothetical protein
MSTELVKTEATEVVGSLSWLLRTGGRLTRGERFFLLKGIFSALGEGFRLRRRARKDERRAVALARFEPPETPMVRSARDYLAVHSDVSMVNHCFRTAFWTLVVLHQHIDLGPQDIETTWVAALLHDVGLEVPPARGDFSLGGVEVLKAFAHELRWSEEQTHQASEAIATNLSTRVDPARVGMVAWAMNVGGLGELGFGLHRAQMHPNRIAELEARYPRAGFRATALRLINEEVARVPDGRFAFLRPAFRILLRG